MDNSQKAQPKTNPGDTPETQEERLAILDLLKLERITHISPVIPKIHF